ncbi:MAG: TIGR01212 family radical SAM protein [Clostridia bacterium]|nr:TIGR01212 family radical SAM protein [Clostridia bacterium]
MAQKDTNPYPYSDSNKRYMTYDWYLKRRFGGKVAKVSLDIGTTCPNKDGFCGHGGCIYCKSGSASAVGDTLDEQYAHGVETACRKWKPVGFIPYFQSNTNTYGDPEKLGAYFRRAMDFDGAVMLDIATRADCLGEDVVAMLASLAETMPLTVELGLQTTDDGTAARINRCHTYAQFTEGYGRLRAAADRVNARFDAGEGLLPFRRMTVCVHLINGLPGESRETMLRSAEDAARLHPDMVKIHLMHVLSDTVLGEMYLRGEYEPMTREDYVSVICDQLEILPADTILGRLTGDGMPDDLLAPLWSRRKTEIVNEIDKEMYRRQSWQGRLAR